MPTDNNFKCKWTKFPNQKMDKKLRLIYMPFIRDLLTSQNTQSEGIEKVFHVKGNQKKAKVATVISEKQTLKERLY